MELSLLPFILTFLLLLFIRTMKHQRGKIARLPPGPWKLPIIGNLHQMLGGLPQYTMRDLARKYGPLMHLQLGEVSTIVVSSPSMAEEVLKTQDLMFADRPVVSASICNATDLVFSPYGAYWRQIRKICVLEVLTAKRIQSFSTIRIEEVSNLICDISSSITGAEEKAINFSEKVISTVNDITAKITLGDKCKDKDNFLSAMHERLNLSSGFNMADLFPSLKVLHRISGAKPKLQRLAEKVDCILHNIILEHEENNKVIEKSEDLVDVLLQHKEDSTLEIPMTTETIKALIMNMINGGTDSPSSTIEWAMSELIRNPRAMEKVQHEVRQVFGGKQYVDETELHRLHYMKLVIKETLRLHPTIPLLVPRECRQSCEINGYEIPKKTKVLVNIWSIGRDPVYWKNPYSFEPERFDNDEFDFTGTRFEYIPFGAGRRSCPGIRFGLANIELLFAQLLYHFNWALPNNVDKLDMTVGLGGTARRKNHLFLVPTLYNNFPIE